VQTDVPAQPALGQHPLHRALNNALRDTLQSAEKNQQVRGTKSIQMIAVPRDKHTAS
jgi:hypothetical protein